MANKINLVAVDVVGHTVCVASGDGEKLYKSIAKAITTKTRVVISFKGVELLTSAFLNTAIGRLYGKFKEEEIRKFLSAKDLKEGDKTLIRAVTDNAKRFYKNKVGQS